MYKYKEEINISKDQWKEILWDSNIVKDSDRKLILRIYTKPNNRVSASELSMEDEVHPSSYNSPIWNLGKRIIKNLDIDIPWVKTETSIKHYWHVILLGFQPPEPAPFEWELRPELKSAIDEIVLERL